VRRYVTGSKVEAFSDDVDVAGAAAVRCAEEDDGVTNALPKLEERESTASERRAILLLVMVAIFF